MGEGIKFERNVEYPDGIHDGVEKNEYRAASEYAMMAVMHQRTGKEHVDELTRLAVARKSALEDWQMAITGMAEVAMSELG